MLKIPYSVAKVLALLEESWRACQETMFSSPTREVDASSKHHWRYCPKAITQPGVYLYSIETGLWKY